MWHRALLVSGLIMLAGCPDRNSPERQARVAVERFDAFTKQMCACKDKACADKVQEDMTRWAEEMAKASNVKEHKPDEETMKKMTEIAQRYAECMTKLMTPAELEPPPRTDVPQTSSSDADALLREARAWARDRQPEHFVAGVAIDYVDANAELDAEHGSMDITFGRSITRRDDPKRKIGAPMPPSNDPNDCFQLSWKRGPGWTRTSYSCTDVADTTNRCSTKLIWKKAIERGAPPAGLGQVRFSAVSSTWTFSIQDEPRAINIREAFVDDCPLAVEK